MKIAIASDHAGFMAKSLIKETLLNIGHKVIDYGSMNSISCDYPDYAVPAVCSVANKQNDCAILICGNGIGMSILANKIPGIIAALVYSEKTASDTKKHHNSNILCLGAREFTTEQLINFINVWLNTEFEGGRHLPRIQKVVKLDYKKN